MVAWLKYCRIAGILTFTLEKLFLKNQIWAKKTTQQSRHKPPGCLVEP